MKGQYERGTEVTFTLRPVLMGARVYIPTLGRFLQTDPVRGGTPNDYVYVMDPINNSDLDGNKSTFPAFQLTMIVTPRNVDRVKNAARWVWQKRNQLVEWKKKHMPWFDDAITFLAMTRGRRVDIRSLSAASLGYSKRIAPRQAPFNSHGQPVYQRGNRYITPDVDRHKGGVWKMFDAKGRRLGTYDALLRRIGK